MDRSQLTEDLINNKLFEHLKDILIQITENMLLNNFGCFVALYLLNKKYPDMYDLLLAAWKTSLTKDTQDALLIECIEKASIKIDETMKKIKNNTI